MTTKFGSALRCRSNCATADDLHPTDIFLIIGDSDWCCSSPRANTLASSSSPLDGLCLTFGSHMLRYNAFWTPTGVLTKPIYAIDEANTRPLRGKNEV